MSALWWQSVVAALFFLLSGLFSASETALSSLSRPRLKKLISQRPALANDLKQWLAAPQFLLTTILIGNTLTNVLTTLLVVNIATTLFPAARHSLVDTVSWLVMTVVLFVFADFVPKSMAQRSPQRVALASIRWVSVLSRWITPVVRRGLAFFERLFPPLEGVPVGKLSVYSLEELYEMIRASAIQGAVPPRSTQMMERALALHRIPVSRIMTPFEQIEAVDLGWDPEQILDRVAEAGHTRVPAYRADRHKIGGYLHIKDLLLVWRGALPLQPDVLLRQPLTAPPSYTAGDLLEDFRKGASHMALVVGAAGDCQGLVTLEDVLEEIVGEIVDESDWDAAQKNP
jgi:CBS domain containing-hemolysin-like protein